MKDTAHIVITLLTDKYKDKILSVYKEYGFNVLPFSSNGNNDFALNILKVKSPSATLAFIIDNISPTEIITATIIAKFLEYQKILYHSIVCVSMGSYGLEMTVHSSNIDLDKVEKDRKRKITSQKYLKLISKSHLKLIPNLQKEEEKQ